MKLKPILSFGLIVWTFFPGISQTNLNLGIAYSGEGPGNAGIVGTYEIEKFQAESFSLPLRVDLGYFSTADYQVVSLELLKGFRKYFPSGLFVEQSIGIGLMSTYYDVDNIFYYDEYANTIRYNEGANLGFMPSIDLGIGYKLNKDRKSQNMIWVRPKLFWNLGFRGLPFPYSTVQIGFSHTLNSK